MDGATHTLIGMEIQKMENTDSALPLQGVRTRLTNIGENEMNEGQLIEAEPQEVAAVTPMSMINIAVEKGADVDQLTKLMELQERYEANEARKAFAEAMNAFKSSPPDIFKNKDVHYGTTAYSHATLDHVAKAITESMAPHGLSFRWDVKQESAQVTVTCVVMHRMGHQESITLSGPVDDSGKKNAIQAIGSAITYLERYTLLAATGLAAKDDDGRAAGGSSNESISDDQYEQLTDKLSQYSKAAWLRDNICKANGVETLDELPASAFQKAMKTVEKYLESN